MEERQRADIGFDDALEGFDPADWTPQPKPRPAAPEKTRALAEASGFKSREAGQGSAPAQTTTQTAAQAPGAKRPPRRRRTGRNMQFNLKAKPETIDRFCAVADAQDWGLGETLEYAVTLLEQTYGPNRAPRG